MSKTMSGRVIGFVLGATLCVATVGSIVASMTATQARPAKQVGPWDAMKAATTKVPGSKAFSATYAHEGNKWLYDVIVIKDKKITEVEVDAATGKVGDTEPGTPEGEGKEMTAELAKAIGAPVSADGEKGEANEKDEKPETPSR